MNKCEEKRREIVLDTRNKYIYCRKCDLNSFNSVREFVNQFNEKVKNHVLSYFKEVFIRL